MNWLKHITLLVVVVVVVVVDRDVNEKQQPRTSTDIIVPSIAFGYHSI
jgi:hypothetical protein